MAVNKQVQKILLNTYTLYDELLLAQRNYQLHANTSASHVALNQYMAHWLRRLQKQGEVPSKPTPIQAKGGLLVSDVMNLNILFAEILERYLEEVSRGLKALSILHAPGLASALGNLD